jgi:CspA family cold shock protein
VSDPRFPRFPPEVQEQWFAEVCGDRPVDDAVRTELLRHVHNVCRGTVKFFKAEKGWGGIESDDTPADVWVWISTIEGDGYKTLTAGEAVEFRWEPAFQDSWRCSATWVRRVGQRPQNMGDANRVEIYWDYGAYPVWTTPELDRTIDAGLRAKLQAWSDRVTDAMWGPDGPDAPGWEGPADAIVKQLDVEGRELADRVQEGLGPEISVVYQPVWRAP